MGTLNKDFIEKLSAIQEGLKCKKGQYNSFGKYHYRSCEDILESVKPLLSGLVLTISDDVIQVGERFYVKSTVSITDGESTLSNHGLAREALTKKGQDDCRS